MPFWRAIGLGIGLVIIRILMPDVFEGLNDTLTAFFSTIKEVMLSSKDLLSSGQTASVFLGPHIPMR